MGIGITAWVMAAAAAGAGAADSPLLLYDAAGQTAFMQALSGGRLTRVGRCVYLANGETRTLLLLPSPQARWNAEREAIRLGGRELRFGDTIRIGGGMGALTKGSLAVEARRRGCDTRRVWWGSPEVVSLVSPAPRRP